MGIINFARRLIGAKALPESYRGERGWSMLSGFRMPDSLWAPSSEVFGSYSAAVAEAAYQAHPIIRACVDKIATTAAEPRLELGTERAGEWEPIELDPGLDLIENPHPSMSQAVLIRLLAGRRALTGCAYLWILRNRNGRAVSLIPIPTSWVTGEPDTGGQRFWKGFHIYGQAQMVPPEDIIFLKQPDLGTVTGYSGCLESAWRAYKLDIQREEYQAEMVTNLKVPGVMIKTDTPLSAEQKEEVRREYQSRFGTGRRGGVGFVSGQNADIQVMNPLADLDWPGLTGLSETRLCLAFGISPLVVHSRAGLERSTFSNYEEANKAFYLSTMSATWEAMGDDLTLGMRDLIPPDARFRFRYDELPAFQEDRTAHSGRIVAQYQAGIIPRTTAQRELGYNPDELAEEELNEIKKLVAQSPPQAQPPAQDQGQNDQEGGQGADQEDEDETQAQGNGNRRLARRG